MENRKLKRRQLVYYLVVLDQSNDQIIGRLADVTTEGLLLISENALPLGQDHDLTVMPPPGEQGRHTPIRIKAQSIWSKRDINPSLFTTGFKFLEIAPEAIQTITDLIDEYELPS